MASQYSKQALALDCQIQGPALLSCCLALVSVASVKWGDNSFSFIGLVRGCDENVEGTLRFLPGT